MLENDAQKTLVWFESNMMVANPSKFQVMFIGLGNDCKLCMEMDKMVIITVEKVKALAATIDSKLKFGEHVKSRSLKANRNVNALSRVAKMLINLNADCVIIILFCQFRFSPLIWMFYGKTANKKINRLRKRALRTLL